MKPTLRKNGKHMITIRTTYRLDRDDIHALLCTHNNHQWEGAPRITKTEAETIIRDGLYASGMEKAYYWNEEMDNDDIARTSAWADEQIKRFWPELNRIVK